MKKLALYSLSVFMLASPAMAAPEIGKAAPDFTATDIKGEIIHLTDYKGKIVVLEWTNHQCPFVRKQYDTSNMQNTQDKAIKDGVVWLTIVSSAPGLQGHVTKQEAQKILDDEKSRPSAKILDESGTIGQLYAAKTTPDMFIVNTDGTLVYSGAIDDQPTPDHSSVAGAKNYVLAALSDLKVGKKVETPLTESYGCAVKYAH